MPTSTQDGDAAAIEHTLVTLLIGFAQRDADALRDVYTEDADWINAFGRRLHGRDEIVEYLRELFADENFTAGSTSGEPDVDVREVTDDVVVATIGIGIAGQKTADGGELPVRRNHSVKVLTRADDGRWLICSEIYSDARDEVTHISPRDAAAG